MRIAIASDHAGYALKEILKADLTALGHEVVDFGAFGEDPVDYPDFVVPAAEAVARGECDRGIVIGGSGNGEAMAANKVPGIRCALCWEAYTARMSRAHNDANVLSLGARVVGVELAREIVQTWLRTEFEGGRHVPRLEKIRRLEEKYMRRG
ncbi:MAG: ribose-5-phosphate isomerase [Armatimonadota bacterium]|nr:ribose-5-phosphate isomerase [Armatimonadota bacterium]MDR7443925.1 ribose-5-phosphate isomerase [Armatimonadota bacterium]MDR7570417.1 ribose-5-phosphate isomerase [Armatimonadota bacterium]MDR7613216.1 ribose-5-phosphate isomerase [Armatimonadota bacterium]